MRFQKILYPVTALGAIIASGAAHTTDEPADLVGICGEGTCHTVADWMGHGMFDLGWFGFFVGFLIWFGLVFTVIHQARKQMADNQSSE